MSEEKKYLIDEIPDAEKPEVEWTSVNGNVFSIIGKTRQVWRDSEHPQKDAIFEEYNNRVNEIINSHKLNGYDKILYLSAYEYTVDLEVDEDEEDYENDEYEDPEDYED